jgi:hypothetical protein
MSQMKRLRIVTAGLAALALVASIQATAAAMSGQAVPGAGAGASGAPLPPAALRDHASAPVRNRVPTVDQHVRSVVSQSEYM